MSAPPVLDAPRRSGAVSREYHLAVVAQRDEQLAAMATQVAAGQALADHLRSLDMRSSEVRGVIGKSYRERSAFLAAFPAGGAR